MKNAKPILFCFTVFIVLVSLPVTVMGDVLTVGGGGAYIEIQDAVNAAQDGDTLLVSSGTYGPVLIDDIGLNVVADHLADVTLEGGLTVQNLSSSRTVALIGLKGICDYQDDRETLILQNNSGSLRVENCTFIGSDGLEWGSIYHARGWDGVHLDQCADSAFINCTLQGGHGYSYGDCHGGKAVLSKGSTVALYDCHLLGGNGGSPYDQYDGGDGGTAYESSHGFLFASGSHFQGGNGGAGADAQEWYPIAMDGGDGGHGIFLKGSAAETQLLGNHCQGGVGGNGGWPYWPNDPHGDPGLDGEAIKTSAGAVLNYLTGDSHSLGLPAPVREDEWFDLDFEGKAGDQAGIILAGAPSSFFSPVLHGQWLLSLSPMPLFVVLGTLPPSGSMTFSAKIPDLGPGVPAATFYLQSIFQDQDQVTLGSARVLVVLDEVY